MVEPLATRRISVPGENQLSFDFDVDDAFGSEQDEGLRELYKLYRDGIAYPDGVRSSAVLESVYNASGKLRLSVSIVDTRSSAPTGYLVKRHGLLSDFEFLEGLRIGEFPSELNARCKEVEYYFTVLKRRAAFQEIHQWRAAESKLGASMSRHYVKFMFPLCDPLGTINYVVSASRLAEDGVKPLGSTLQRPILVA